MYAMPGVEPKPEMCKSCTLPWSHLPTSLHLLTFLGKMRDRETEGERKKHYGTEASPSALGVRLEPVLCL